METQTNEPSIARAARTGVDADRVDETIRAYEAAFDTSQGDHRRKRRDAYAELVNRYYDLVTDFYELGWGESFHFAARYAGEPLDQSIKRHEHYLAMRLGLLPHHRVLDVGCGIGGPMREIARFSGAEVVGVNNNAYQIERGRERNERAGLAERCSFVQADFVRMELEPESFDAAYAIEATCHAPDRAPVFAAVHRALRPGALFAGYEWCVTDRYDPANAEHREIIHHIEEGDALPELAPTSAVDAALRSAGFEILETRDLAPECETPWYRPLTGEDRTLRSIPRTSWGRVLVNRAVRIMEAVRLAPAGSTRVSSLLNRAGDALVRGGELGIFTPMYFFLAQRRS